MYIPTVRDPEAKRLAALHSLNVMDTPRESPLDRLVFIAAQAFRAPMAAVVLIDEERAWFKARVGFPEQEMSRHLSLCSHAIQSADPFVVEDASADNRFCDNPLVAGAPFIRFYAGVPLVGPGNFRVGMFCVLDRVARAATAAQIRLLVALADNASDLLLARVVEDGSALDWLGYTSDT